MLSVLLRVGRKPGTSETTPMELARPRTMSSSSASCSCGCGRPVSTADAELLMVNNPPITSPSRQAWRPTQICRHIWCEGLTSSWPKASVSFLQEKEKARPGEQHRRKHPKSQQKCVISASPAPPHNRNPRLFRNCPSVCRLLPRAPWVSGQNRPLHHSADNLLAVGQLLHPVLCLPAEFKFESRDTPKSKSPTIKIKLVIDNASFVSANQSSHPRSTFVAPGLMGMEAKCGGLAVAAGATVRRPLQPRDTNVAASTVVVGRAAPKPRAKPKTVTRLAASPSPSSSPPPPPPVVVKPRVKAECGAAVVPVAEVSLAEELERARERRGRLREARERTEREMDGRAEALDREAAEWERRAEEQRRLVSELMRLIGMPEVYTPVESLRSREERKRREAIGHSGSRGSTSTASTFPPDVGAESCSDQESVATGMTKEMAIMTEIGS